MTWRDTVRSAILGVPVDPLKRPDPELFDQGMGELADAIEDLAESIEEAELTADSISKGTWAQLSAITGTRNGQRGEVSGPDAGTHTDPVVGGTKANIGIYGWSVSPAGWQWLRTDDITTLTAEVTAARKGKASLLAAIDQLEGERGENIFVGGFLDIAPLNPDRVNGSAIIDIPLGNPLRDLGFDKYFIWPAAPSTNSEYLRFVVPDDLKAHLFGKYVAAGYFAYSSAGTFMPYAFIRIEGAASVSNNISGNVNSYFTVGTNTRVLYQYGQMPSVGGGDFAVAADLKAIRVGYTSNPAGAGELGATGFFLAFSSVPFDVGRLPLRQRAIGDVKMATAVADGPIMTLDGLGGGSIEVDRGGVIVKRSFGGVGEQTIIPLNGKPNFSQTSDEIDGVELREMSDDESPALLASPVGHFGGQHQYSAGYCTAAAHGLTSTALGQVRTKGGVTAVVVEVPTTGAIALAVEGSDVLPTMGVWTYVSGPGGTGSVTVSAVSTTPYRWGPMAANREQFPVVDNRRLVNVGGVTRFNINAGFSESYTVIPREDVLDHIKANGSDLSGLTGTPIFDYSNSYIYDQDANLTVPMSFVARQTLTPNRLYGAQIQLSGAGSHSWYIPGALPFTQDATPYDFAMIQPAIAPASEILLNSAKGEALTGDNPLFFDRFVIMSATHYLAVVLLPIQAAEPTARASNVPGTNTAISIATTGKAYLSAFNDTDASKAAGWNINWSVGRNLGVRTADRTCFDIYRHPVADFIYMDWHDKAGFDKVNLPFDLCGREFSVFAKRNVELINDELNGFLLPEVDAAGDYARLVLRVEH